MSWNHLAFADLHREGDQSMKAGETECEFNCHSCDHAWRRPAMDVMNDGLPTSYQYELESDEPNPKNV